MSQVKCTYLRINILILLPAMLILQINVIITKFINILSININLTIIFGPDDTAYIKLNKNLKYTCQ